MAWRGVEVRCTLRGARGWLVGWLVVRGCVNDQTHGGFRASEVELARLRCYWQRGRVGRCLRDVCCAAVASRMDRWCAWAIEVAGDLFALFVCSVGEVS